MRTLLRFFAPLIGLWLANLSLPAHALQAFTAHYQANYMGIQAEGFATLEAVTPQQWRYTLTVKNPLGRIRQSTLFEQAGDASVLRPLNSLSDTRFPFQRRVVHGHYDWDTRQATWTGDARPSRRGPIPLEEGDMDGLLVNLAVMRDLAQGRPLRYRMVDNGRAVSLDYNIIGTENVTINGQALQATRVERMEPDRDRQQIAWIAPNLPAPVRIVQRENGKVTLTLTLVPNP